MKYREKNSDEVKMLDIGERFEYDAVGRGSVHPAAGRVCMKILAQPFISKAAHFLLGTALSKSLIRSYADKHNVDMNDLEREDYACFNDFAARRLRKGTRSIAADTVISPCDGYAFSCRIASSGIFVVKNSVYSVKSLLKDKKLAERFYGGTVVIFTIAPADCHRYAYCCGGIKSHDRIIRGRLYQAFLESNRYLPVYSENLRSYCLIRTKNFGDIAQAEIASAATPQAVNWCEDGGVPVRTGEEKGWFESGCGAIILFLGKNVKAREDIEANSRSGLQTRVMLGESVIM